MAEDMPPSTWSRTIGWRQSHVLPADAIAGLGLAHEADTVVMVISHDCDLANDDLEVEPSVEVMVGRRVPEANQSLTRTKSPRILHLEMTCDGVAACVELTATAKRLIPKSRLAAWRPDSRYRLNPTGLEILRHWLAVRYKRAAFPDEFDRRMRKVTKLAQSLDKIVKDVDLIVSAVYFRLDTFEERAPEDPTPYELTVVLAFEPGADPEQSDDQASDAAEKIRESFKKKCFDEKTGSWKHIKLVDAVAISEEDLTVHRARQLHQWRLEHISLKPDADL
jgi:hypothetical protein